MSIGRAGNVPEKTRFTIEEQLQEILPLPDDLEGYIATIETVPANSILTITWTTRENYDFYIKKLYCDAALGCAYQWTLEYVYFFSPNPKVLPGNEHEFTRRCILKGGYRITLEITNLSAIDHDLDIVIDLWARRSTRRTVKEEEA